jgi:hypothetical protein
MKSTAPACLLYQSSTRVAMDPHERPGHRFSGLHFVLYVIAFGLLLVFAGGCLSDDSKEASASP